MKTFAELRDQYVNGDLFDIGEIVLDKKERTVHEVVDLGANYITVIDASGNISKKWLTDLIIAESLREDFEDMRRKRSSSNQIAFAGYKTNHFSEEVFNIFKPLIKEHKADKFAVLSLIRVTDELLREGKSINSSNYNKIRTLIERSEKYLDKFNQLMYHTYRNDFIESLTLYELDEGMKVTSLDRQRAAKIIGDAIGVESKSTPEETINAAATYFKSGRHTPEAWKIAGKMFNMATDIGIQWDKTIFAKSTRTAMEIK